VLEESTSPPSNPEDLRHLCQGYLDGLFQGITGFVSYQPGEKESFAQKNIFLTYGEILFPSLNTVIDKLDLNTEDVFYDLGSGVGKVPLQVFLLSPVRAAYGIEASVSRSEPSKRVLTQVKNDLPELFTNNRDLQFITSNFLEHDLTNATVVYTCATCFSDELLQNISDKLALSPNLKYILSLKAFNPPLALRETVEIECTWGTTQCYIYAK